VDNEDTYDLKLEERISEIVEKKGVSRRDFMKFCGLMAATLGLEASYVPKIAAALAGPTRPPVVWLQFGECTGCTEAFLRTSNPFLDDLLLSKISLDYHETIMAPAGEAATLSLSNTVDTYAGQFLCFVEGAIPTADNGIYGMIGGETMLRIASDVCPKALKVIAVGSCACDGGLPAAQGGLTGAKGVKDATGISTINLPGCPPNPVNMAALIVNYLLQGTFPALDASGRPLFAYGSTVHDGCPRHDSQWCLEGYGCRGKTTYHNCSSVKFNDATSWCVQADAPCSGCSQSGFWDQGSFFNFDGRYGD
jgi:[NiFe] hydrogenase small subunit